MALIVLLCAPSLRSAIRDEARKLDQQTAVDIDRAPDIMGSTLSRQQQLGMMLMLWFGAAAVARAAVGIDGVIAYGAVLAAKAGGTRKRIAPTALADVFDSTRGSGGACRTRSVSPQAAALSISQTAKTLPSVSRSWANQPIPGTGVRGMQTVAPRRSAFWTKSSTRSTAM